MVPRIRYNSTNIDFTNNVNSPNFPINSGETFHSYIGNKPELTFTSRKHGTTEINWQSKNLKKNFRDTIYNFWNTTIKNGYEKCTVIDHRGRILFDAHWYRWVENWSAKRGGVYDINYNFISSVPWTLPTIGVYSMTSTNLNSHNLRTEANLPLSGTMTSNTFRANGYVLNVNNGITGGVSSTEIQHQTEDSSFSIFGQIYSNLSNIVIASFRDVNTGAQIALELGAIGLYGYYNDTQTTHTSIGITPIPSDIWNDVALAYNATTKKMYLYTWPSGDIVTKTYTDYLYNAANIALYYATDNVNLDFTPVQKWNQLRIGANNSGSVLNLTNVMLMEGCLSAMEFNTLRRLCYNWNSSTDVNPA